jgi:hypothetical protein
MAGALVASSNMARVARIIIRQDDHVMSIFNIIPRIAIGSLCLIMVACDTEPPVKPSPTAEAASEIPEISQVEAGPTLPKPAPLMAEEMRQGEMKVREMIARDQANALDGTSSEKERAYRAHMALSGALQDFEDWTGMLGNYEGNSQAAVNCGARTAEWRNNLLTNVRAQMANNPDYQALRTHLTADEELAAEGALQMSKKLMLSENWRTPCDEMGSIPWLRNYDRVAAGVAPIYIREHRGRRER